MDDIHRTIDWFEGMEAALNTAGGKITCPRCQAMSKRTGEQCGAPAERGKRVCRFHGARSTGAKTEAGRQRIVAALTKYGRESRAQRERRALKLRELKHLFEIFLRNTP